MSMLHDLLESIFKLGLPLAGLSWLLFSRIYNSGSVDRAANRKAIKSQVKTLRSDFKAKAKLQSIFKSRSKAPDPLAAEVAVVDRKLRTANLIYDKWMWFGSAFYGLAALWTFAIIEISDIFNFIFNNPGWSVLFGNGVISLIVDVLTNQLQNLLSAFLWFGYWDTESVLLWVLVAYAGYWAGVEAARRDIVIPVATWMEKLRSLLKSLDP